MYHFDINPQVPTAMPETDILANLLHLSSEARSADALLGAALDAIVDATGVEAAAIAAATPPTWSIPATRGIATGAVPIDLAAEALEYDAVVRRERWQAAPLVGSRALLLRGQLPESQIATAAQALSDALTIVDDRSRLTRRAGRLETILEITREWQQTNDMESLLVRMAEASTKMFAADRASIFLWDKANRTIVGRPALGVEGGELRLPDDAGVVGQVIQTGECRRVAGSDDAAEIDRSADKKTGYQTTTILCVPLESPDGKRLGAFELLNKKNGQFTADDEAGLAELAAQAAVALENTQQFERLLQRQVELVAQAAMDTLLVGESPAIQAVRSTIRRVADTELAILILGENGTGKEVVARALHYGSRRRNEPFMPVNCAALSETLARERAVRPRKGRVHRRPRIAGRQV